MFIILIVVLINAVLGVYQESKAEKAIEALQEMTAATSKVIRGRQTGLAEKRGAGAGATLSFWKPATPCPQTAAFWRAPA